MADLDSIEKLWRQSIDLNIRYYTMVGRLTIDYYKELFATVTALQPKHSQPRPPAQPSVPAAPSTPYAATTAAPVHQPGVMVLESAAGGQALGVFLVANNLDHEVSARVAASTFAAENGHTVQPSFVFDPEVINLASGEQILVRVVTVIDDSLEPEERYRGGFTVPELEGTHIPIVLRRRKS